MKDHFRYVLFRPFGDEKLISHSKHYLNGTIIIVFLIAALGSIASGFIMWQWLPTQFSVLALCTVFITFIILWLLSAKIITYELPSPLRTTQKLHLIFLNRNGWGFNWRFLILMAFSIFTAPTLFTLTLLPAIDQFNQQQFANEKAQRLQKSESDYNKTLKLVNNNIAEERNTFDLLVNEEDGEDLDNINLTIKSLEHLEEEKFHLLQEFSQEDAQLKQATLTNTRQLFSLSLPSNINNTQKALLENQTHWKYSALEFFCLFFPALLIIALLLFKLFQPKSVSYYLNQRLKTEIEAELKSTSIHKPIDDEGTLSIASLLSSNNEELPIIPQKNIQEKTLSLDKITLLRKERAVVLSEIKTLKHSFDSQEITKKLFIQKLNTLETNIEVLSDKVLKILLNNAKTALTTYSNENNSTKIEKNTKELLNA